MRTLTVIVGANGSGKTHLMHRLIDRYQTESSRKFDAWPVLSINSKKIVVVGKYSKKNILGGADLLHGNNFWISLRDASDNFYKYNFLMEGQRFGYGVNYKRLFDFCEFYGFKLKVILLNCDSKLCFERIKQRQSKKKFSRRKPTSKGYYNFKNVDKQNEKIFTFFTENTSCHHKLLINVPRYSKDKEISIDLSDDLCKFL